MNKIERTHDKLYLNESRRKKEYFKKLYKMINDDMKNRSEYSLLDIGCAAGDFLYFAKNELPKATLFGLEYMQELVDKINFGVPAIQGNICDENTLPNKKYDVITMLGVLSIFDDFSKPLLNALSMLANNGYMYLFGIFNPENIDVLIKSKNSGLDLSDNEAWEVGWNLFSIVTIESFLTKYGFMCEFIPFNIDIEIEKHSSDPLRTWTEKTENGLMLINGLQLRHPFYFCKIWIE